MSKSERRLSSLRVEPIVTRPSGKLSSERSRYEVKRKIETKSLSNGGLNAAIYCRVSTKEQTQNLSLSTQERSCREYCEREGFVVARVFAEEGESAKTTERTKLIELLDYCRENKGKINHVVVYRLDRFPRQQYDYVVLAAQLKKYEATIKRATEPIGDDSTGNLMEHILSAFAQFDNDVRAERTVAGMKAALESGQWTFGVPIGYRKVDAASRDSIEPDPVSGPLVRQAF